MHGKLPFNIRTVIKKTSFQEIVAFLLTLTLCLLLVFAMVVNRSKVERLLIEQLILEKSIKINEVMSKLLYKTQVLSSIVLQNNGEIINFEQMATLIIDDPAILNILVAPRGVVSHVYPLEGNESVLGLNFFEEGAGNKEAVLAKETGQLVMGGPFTSVQGEQVLVGRLPLFIDEPGEERYFWGLVSVTLKYPQALDGAGLNELKIQNFAYEIWRVNPDSNERQIITHSGHKYNRNTHYVEMPLSIMNADWYFRILPIRTWYEFPETWISVLISICVSILVAAIVRNNQELKSMKCSLEMLSYTDSLTNIHNRRHFMEYAFAQTNMAAELNSEAYIIIFDFDRFKLVNDCYGHQMGDIVLKESSNRVAKLLRSGDLFARYGGEEFIIFVTKMNKAQVMRLAERIRLDIAGNPINACGIDISITISLGIAPVKPAFNLETAIAFADSALYTAKSEGRNKTAFYEEE